MSNNRPRVRHARIISAVAFVFEPKNGQAHQGRAGPGPLAWWTTARCALTNRLPRVRRAQSSQAPGREPPLPPPTRIGAEALNATNDEKIRELVIALMGQEPGDEPRRPRTPLLAPFITHDVLLRVNNSLTPLNNAERGGWGLQAALGRAVAALTGAPRAACMEDARHEGQRDAGQGPPRCARPLTRTLTVTEP